LIDIRVRSLHQNARTEVDSSHGGFFLHPAPMILVSARIYLKTLPDFIDRQAWKEIPHKESEPIRKVVTQIKSFCFFILMGHPSGGVAAINDDVGLIELSFHLAAGDPNLLTMFSVRASTRGAPVQRSLIH